MRSRGSAVSCMRACSISMMMLLACAPDSAFVVSSSRSSASDRTVGARRETVQVAVRGDVERIGEPSVVAFAFLRQLLRDRVRGFRGRLPFLGRVIARFRKSGQTAEEPFLDDLAWQLAGERVERGAQQRDVQHGIAAQQQSQHPGLIHGPEPFHFPSYIRQRRPVLPFSHKFPDAHPL